MVRARSIDPLIAKLERLGPLTEEEKTALQALPSRLREFGRHETIVAAGESPTESVVLLSGMALRARFLDGGRRQIVSLQVPGDFVDLHAFVLHPLDHSVIAAAPAWVGLVPHEKINMILQEYPRLTKRLMWDMALDGAIAREWMTVMGKRSAYQQLAHLFCELYFRINQARLANQQSFELPLSQTDLADMCGLSAVHVNRSLQALRADGLIVLKQNCLTIPDLSQLIAAANFNQAYLHLLKKDFSPPLPQDIPANS